MLETINYKNFSINIEYDQDPLSPIEDYDCGLSIMACAHRSYNLGNSDISNICREKNSWEEVSDAIIKQEKAICLIPLYLYDHSGLSISTAPFSCRWDSGQIGFVYTTKERLSTLGFDYKRISSKRLSCIRQALIKEVAVYDEYLTGNVYSYRVIDKAGSEIDSCYNYLGDWQTSGLLDDAKASIDHYLTT
jgi:hypothetical protein